MQLINDFLHKNLYNLAQFLFNLICTIFNQMLMIVLYCLAWTTHYEFAWIFIDQYRH